MATEQIKRILQSLPGKPGVYQYFDKQEKLLYVGKAKDLKKRVSSYFTKSHDSAKVRVMVGKIEDIRVIEVETELDALLLENNLIKEHQPRYNILLRDDKTYPWLCIKKEPFPRIFSTRNKIMDGSEYFGPYASGKVLKNMLELIRHVYPIRTCSLNLTKANIEAGKFKICLEYHIGNCLGPCEDLQNEEAYLKDIQHVRSIVKGNLKEVRSSLVAEMKRLADEMSFESAQKVKEKLDLLDKYQARSTVVSPTIRDAEVFSVFSDVQSGFVNYLKIIDGALVQSYNIELRKRLDESDEELLRLGMVEIGSIFPERSKEIYTSIAVETVWKDAKLHVPQRGEKKELIDLSLRNARAFRLEQVKQLQIVDPDRHVNRIMKQMQEDLRLPEEPVHIECFDNSNIQGSHPVAACVVFKNAKPAKKEYRHFNIKTVEGPNDFASMEEVIERRYSRLLSEGAGLPQLIVVDGGKGQLSSAVKSLEKLGLRGKISIIGIAKRLEEIYYPEDSVPLYLDKRSESLKVIQHMRNEAHRFGITHHRSKRSKAAVGTELESIPGIGKGMSTKLLKAFKSVKKLREQSLEEITSVVGPAKAKIVFEYLHSSPFPRTN